MTESLNPIHNNRVDIMNLLVDQVATSRNVSETEKNTESASFSQFFSEACDAGVDLQDMFQAAFPGNVVQTKVGCCDVPWSSWDRNDCPIWEYFKRNTTADCLNNWRPTGLEPPQWDLIACHGAVCSVSDENENLYKVRASIALRASATG